MTFTISMKLFYWKLNLKIKKTSGHQIKFSCCWISFIEPNWCTSSIIAWYRFRTLFVRYGTHAQFDLIATFLRSSSFILNLPSSSNTFLRRIETYLAETKSWEIIMNHCFFHCILNSIQWELFSPELYVPEFKIV